MADEALKSSLKMGGKAKWWFYLLYETADLEIQPLFLKRKFHMYNEVPRKNTFYKSFLLTTQYNLLFYDKSCFIA